ncbi:MAG TPA: site-2 protease family protein [Vicinamibacterales bacterium]|nr:site-2 protease family protein [Vicinamibacterales bacterium]
MGRPSPTDPPEIPIAEDRGRPYVMPPSRRPDPITRHVVLFVLTFLTATLVGAQFYASFATGAGTSSTLPSLSAQLLHGMWYSAGVLLILGTHEFGHYFACRYYGIDASLPYFIPIWLGPFFTPGTLGAVIRIRQPIPTKRQFFDVGIAGPIAGFVVLVPVLFLGMSLSNVVTLPADFVGYDFGEPLLFKLIAWLFFGKLAVGQTVNLHPAGWAAWFGLLATALNLCPISQLDGGHISYAVFGRISSTITLIVVACLIGLTIYSMAFLHSGAYLVWTLLVLVMLRIMGRHHPRTPDENEPLDTPRLLLAGFAIVMMILCFTPVPTSIVGR